MKKGLKIFLVLVLVGALLLGGAIYTIISGRSTSASSLMKTTFAEEVLMCNENPNGIHFKLLGPGIIEEVLKRLNLSEDELKSYWENGKTLLDYAHDKGITKEKLIETFKEVITEKVNQLLSENKITETEKENILKNLDSKIETFITKAPPFGKGRGPKDGVPPNKPPFGKGIFFDEKGLMEEVLLKLNLSLDEFQSAVKDGKTLLEFAESKGITKDKLVSVVKEVVLNKIDQLVKDGKITEDQKAKFIENLDYFVERFINGPRRGPGKGRDKGFTNNWKNFNNMPTSSNL